MVKLSVRRLLAGLVLVSLVVGLAVQTTQGTAMAMQMTAAMSADLPMADGYDDCDHSSSSIDCHVWSCVGQAVIASTNSAIELPYPGLFGDHAYTLYLGQSPGPDPHPPRRSLHA